MKEKKLLIVEGNGLMRMTTENVLKRAGYNNILEAESGEEAIEMIKSHHPDLVLTSLRLPGGMQGKEMIEWIAREYRPLFSSIKIIAMSGDLREIVEPMVKKAGCDAFLSKPFSGQDLIKEVEALLA